MRYTLLSLFCLFWCMPFATNVAAQDTVLLTQVGWDPLPDSLVNAWRLPQDQVRRLRVIEEDYNGERSKLMSDASLSDGGREARMRELANQRREEIRAVLPMRQYDDWLAASRARR